MRGGATKLLMLLSTPFPLPLRIARHSRLFFASASIPRRHHRHLSSSPPNPPLSFKLRAEIHSQAVESAAEPWPEWARLVESVGGCAERGGGEGGVGGGDDELESLPEWFVRDARACLAFARQRPELLRLLPRKDIEVVVENGSPFLFNDALNSSRRMRSFLGGQDDSEMTSEKAETVDIVRYLLSYVYNQLVLSEKYSNTELVEASVRNLFTELVNISGPTSPHLNMPIYGQALSDLNMPIHEQTTYGLDQPQRQQRQNVEMKRGDWICSKCNFMNFARNSKCLECNEGRPKRQLAGGEWECPQCDFFNYGRNMVCLRCDCKRPEQKVSSPSPHTNTNIEYGDKSSFEKVYTRSSSDNSEIERRLAENDAKAERWFSKVSQLGDSADLSSAITDEDFPEIMPLRKGVNRFVVSTKKTPLERRLANENFKRNAVSSLSNDNYSPSSAESSINKTLDRILGQSSTASGKGSDSSHQSTAREVNSGTGGDSLRSRDPGYVPFVPLSADKFRKPQTEGQQSYGGANTDTLEPTRGYSASKSIESEKTNILPNDEPENVVGNSDISQSSDHLSERRSKKVAEVHDTKNLSSAVPDDDFPDIMPVRKGENRFVISKKKDRSLTSPQYKRRLAMEQSIDSNFVPFVPFPPDYFAKKDKQPESENPNMKTETGNANESPKNVSEPKSPDRSFGSNIYKPQSQSQSYGASRSTTDPLYGRSSDTVQSGSSSWTNKNESWESKSFQPGGPDAMNAAHSTNASSWNANSESIPQSSWNNVNIDANNGFSRRIESSNIYGNQPSNPQQNNNDDSKGQGGQFSTSNNSGPTNNSESLAQQTTNSQSRQNGWNGGFSGKSLEGSAVTEPDPLDMSEEAKAQRWFRRVAQITDISELSKIPDEDFPEIMPMRKGVNRFVVSKRKTPLERRLTSPQYRRNLPIVSSDPEKDANRGSS